MITLEEQIAEIRRELALRKRCYPGWVRRGTLTPDDAKYQLLVLEEVLQTLQRLETAQRQLSLLP